MYMYTRSIIRDIPLRRMRAYAEQFGSLCPVRLSLSTPVVRIPAGGHQNGSSRAAHQSQAAGVPRRRPEVPSSGRQGVLVRGLARIPPRGLYRPSGPERPCMG